MALNFSSAEHDGGTIPNLDGRGDFLGLEDALEDEVGRDELLPCRRPIQLETSPLLTGRNDVLAGRLIGEP